MTEGDHSRIEVAVRLCHLVTFVRHCTFKPSFFSPSSSPHPFLPRPIVWIPLVAFYVQIGKLEGKRSSVRDSLWSHNGGLVQHLLLFCSPPPTLPILLSHFMVLSPQTSIVFQKEFTCSVFAFFDTRQGQGWCVAFLGTVSLPVCKWNPLGVLVDGCEKLEICAEWWPSRESGKPWCAADVKTLQMKGLNSISAAFCFSPTLPQQNRETPFLVSLHVESSQHHCWTSLSL